MEQNIKDIILQTGASEEVARESYNIDNDIINSIIRILDPNWKPLLKTNDKPMTEHQEKIAELREILDSKDKLFVNYQKQMKTNKNVENNGENNGENNEIKKENSKEEIII